jgi:hypothetical protein
VEYVREVLTGARRMIADSSGGEWEIIKKASAFAMQRTIGPEPDRNTPRSGVSDPSERGNQLESAPTKGWQLQNRGSRASSYVQHMVR